MILIQFLFILKQIIVRFGTNQILFHLEHFPLMFPRQEQQKEEQQQQ